MKIDTETTEPDIIAGGPKFLSTAMPVIIVEILESNDTAARLTEELSRSGYGFQPFLLTDAGPVKHDSLAADSRWRNHLLVPREGPGVLAFRDTLAAFGAN